MKNIGRYIVIALVIAAIGFILWYFKNIVVYILISAILSLIGRPIVEMLGRIRVKNITIPNGIRALLALIFLWFIFGLFIRIFIPLVANQANELSTIDVELVINNLERPVEKASELYEKYSLGTQEDESLEIRLQNYLMSVLNFSFVSNLFGSIAGILGNIFIAVFSISFITFFFLKDSRMFSNSILLFIPTKYENGVSRALHSSHKLLRRYFLGIAFQITGIIILVTTGLTIIGIEFRDGLVIGLVAGLLNIIPYIGPVMGTILGTLLGAATNLHLPFVAELLPLMGYMVIVFISVQVIDNTLFQPLIYSSSVNAHPLEIFLVIMMAGSMAGITGMILAIPAYTILRVFGKEFFNHLKLVKKLTEKID
ncbi:MAG: AI-2E family transporter [Bacteroidota bacterium]